MSGSDEGTPRDCVVRAMTTDGAFRVIAASTTATARQAAETQGAAGAAAARLGELIVGAVLVRETVHPALRVQVILQDLDGSRRVADSRPDGTNRALVNPGDSNSVVVGAQPTLQVNYTLKNGELHQGIVAVSEDGDISKALMSYLQVSEQVFAIADVAAHMDDDDTLAHVTGYVVQLLPEADRDGLAAMTARLAELQSAKRLLNADEHSPRDLIRLILEGQDYAELSDSELCFGCTCSHERMLLGIGSLPRSEIVEMIDAAEPLEVSCDGCGRRYQITVDELSGLLLGATRSDGSVN